MTIVINQERVDDWCARVRELWTNEGGPIPEGDPRRDAFERIPAHMSPEDLGHKYFEHLIASRDDLGLPLPLPAWAERGNVEYDGYPEMSVMFGVARTVGETTVRAATTIGIIVEVHADSGGEIFLPGDVIPNENIEILVESPKSLTLDRARDTAAALQQIITHVDSNLDA